MKQLFSFIAVSCIAIMGTSPAVAYDFESGGLYYNKLSDSTVEVTYGGSDTGTATYGSSYKGDITVPSVVEDDKIQYTVVKIGDNAFRGVFNDADNEALTSVKLPNTITEIGAYAFMYRRVLTSVLLSENLQTIGREAFLLCQSLKSIDVPASVKVLPLNCFQLCNKMEYVILHEGLEEIGNGCFSGCDWLEYSDTEKTKFTTVPSTVKKIGNNAFNNCNYIYKFELGDNIVFDDSDWWCGFDGCTRLAEITLPQNIRGIDYYCFRDNVITELTIPGGANRLNVNAFGNNSKLETLEFAYSATPLQVYGGEYTNSLPLKKLVLAREFNKFPFGNEKEIVEVVAAYPDMVTCPAFSEEVFANATLKVPAGKVNEYKNDAGWGKFANITDGSQPWLSDVTFDCVAEDGNIYVHPRRIAGLLPHFVPEDAATWQNVTYTLENAGTSKDDMLASLYTVNYWKPERVRFPELQGYRTGECKLVVKVSNPNDSSEEPFVKEFNVFIVNDVAETPADGYLDGTIILNEEWFGHTNGSLNYITPENDVIYQAYERENPGMSFGCTSQFGTIWADKLIVVSKQQTDGGDPLPGGGRFVIADAKSLKRLGSIDCFTAEKPDGTTFSGDGRAVAGATRDKVYVTTSAGIFIVDIADPAKPFVAGYIEESVGSDTSDLYNGQFGDIINGGRYVFALSQKNGIMVIDPLTDKYVTTIGDSNCQGITQTADGTVWYTTIDGSVSKFVSVNPETLETIDTVILPESVGKVTCGWGAWRSTAFYGDYKDNEIWFVTGSAGFMGGASGDYYRYVVGDNPEELAPFFTLAGVKGVTDFGEEVNLMTYGTPRFDPRNNRLIVMCGRKGAASGGYRDHWILFVDGDTGEITHNIKLEPYYWFQSLPIFPDKYDAEFNMEDQLIVSLKDGETRFDLSEYITDPDNIDHNIQFSIEGDAVAPADESEELQSYSESGHAVALRLDGKVLVAVPNKVGLEYVTVHAESNGRPVQKEIAINVVNGTDGVDDIYNADGHVTSNGSRIFFNGLKDVTFDIFDLNGSITMSIYVDDDNYVAQPGLASGTYVLRGSNGCVSKVVIR